MRRKSCVCTHRESGEAESRAENSVRNGPRRAQPAIAGKLRRLRHPSDAGDMSVSRESALRFPSGRQ